MSIAQQLAEIGIQVRPDGCVEQRVPCPQCAKGDRDDALGVNLETGVYHCFRCSWSGRAGERESRAPAPQAPLPRPAPSGDTLARIWARTLPLRGTLAEVYLEHRHCVLPPADSDLRFLPSSERYPPSLCALITDAVTNKPMSLHFTRLASDGRGKAGTERDKTLLKYHRKAGGVIRLWPDTDVRYGLGIAEGIETALSAGHAFTPVWATVDAGNMAAFPVLPGIESLVIFADNDAAGLSAARACAQRWVDAGRDAEIRIPDLNDFNDVVAA
jgi:putative DNA primase/helicase